MKLTTIILLVACLQISARGLSQGITINKSDVPLETVLQDIEKQSGYQFFYKVSLANKFRSVTVSIKNASLKDAMAEVLKDLPLTYEIVNKTIVIKEKDDPKVLEPEIPAPIDVKGRVLNEKGEPVEGATVTEKGTKNATATNVDGYFVLKGVNENAVLVFTGVNIESFELKVGGKTDLAIIDVKTKVVTGETITVNTGYQLKKPNEETGSTSTLSRQQIERSVSTDVIKRIDGMMRGVLINGNNSIPLNNVSVDSRSTIFANPQPLFVVDNFPYTGDLSAINPNDIESITLLKDAASASVWGAYSGNGVFVITTKKGKYNQGVKVNFNTRISVTEQPDLYYDQNFLNSSETIDIETWLFKKGFYDADLGNTISYPVVSQAVEILAMRRAGLISSSDSAIQLDALRGVDIRNDYSKYFYRKAVSQEYALNISGGSEKANYYLSGGYNKDLSNVVINQNERVSFTFGVRFKPIKKLEISGGLDYTNGKNQSQALPFATSAGKPGASPYAQLADADGNPLHVAHDYRYSFVESPPVSGLLDWRYMPLNELKENDNITKSFTNRVTAGIRYEIIKGLNAEFKYQYLAANSLAKNYHSVNSYFARDLINSYSAIINNTVVRRNIPYGGILTMNNNYNTSNAGRGQLNYSAGFGQHTVSAFAAVDVSDGRTEGNSTMIYGYDENTGSYVPVNYDSIYVQYPSGSRRITMVSPIKPYALSRKRSFAGNASYTYASKYILYISGRLDQANIFGVKTNQKGTPLWSTGFSWIVDKEKFYHAYWLPSLQIRVSYGYNGNYSNTNTAYTVGTAVSSGGINSTPITYLNAPGNPNLRWEKIGVFNIGLDFEMGKSALQKNDNNKTRGARKNQKILWGTIEYYHKNGTNMFGSSAIPSSTGFYFTTGNNSDLVGNGIDIELNTGAGARKFRWDIKLLFSYATDKVTKINSLNTGIVVGRPLSGVYSYRWGGLDANGDPQGYLGDTLTKDYNTIILRAAANPSFKVYSGPGVPVLFGSLLPRITVGRLSLSVLVKYKGHYYFRKNSIAYPALLNSGFGHIDYTKRWQKNGDDALTNVPALVYTDYPQFSQRDNFYRNSEAVIEKGDHIRLQDININFTLDRTKWKSLPFASMNFYFYANNLGIIWKANKQGLDPDKQDGYPSPRSYSFGIRAEF